MLNLSESMMLTTEYEKYIKKAMKRNDTIRDNSISVIHFLDFYSLLDYDKIKKIMRVKK